MFISDGKQLDRARSLFGERPELVFAGGGKEILPKLPILEPLWYYSGLSGKGARLVVLRSLILFILSLALVCLTLSPLCLVLPPVHFALEYARLRWLAKKRASKFEKDYTALLLSLASAVKTGMDPMSALLSSRELFEKDSEVRSELEKLTHRSEQGGSEEEVILSFADSISHPDLGLFRAAFILARQEGSSLAHCLRRLAKVTRARQSFRRKMRAAVAMQKLSTYGIAGCAVILVSMQFLSSVDTFDAVLEHPIGVKLLLLGAVLMFGGMAWMMMIARARD